MYFIPGFLISAVTFPGVIVHELAHQIFCRLMQVPVYEVKYFQLSNPCGYVIHEPCDKPLKSFFISIGPFLINTILGMFIMLPASVELFEFRNFDNFLNLILAWLGISILMHAFPSKVDAENMIESILKNKEVPIIFRILVTPIIGLIYIGSYGSVVWLDLIYAIAISIMLPKILVQIF
ncbi:MULTISPECIES: metalloprotease family protein [unclassified Clostridium]|uniref:metalloprotease family protein n=1 Tax=unclassified Clostridium TaxID=2614128 RepID=UPI00207AA12F|nr:MULTISPECIES: metalloprotease family protein [unclassified Clostridium]